MKSKRLRIALAILTFAGLGLLVLRPLEPRYGGKPISYWIDRSGLIGEATDEPVFDWMRFPKLDSNAVPFLAQALRRGDERSGPAYRNLWRRSPFWLQGLLPRSLQGSYVRLYAVIELVNLGKDAKPAIPALVRALKGNGDPNVREYAALALGRIDTQNKIVREALISALNDNDFMVRLLATNALSGIAPEAAAKAGVK
jgi:HEAT repeat protein